jgi:uncharacterized protein DUF6941
MKADRKKKEKPKHIYTIICETLIADKDDRFSFINVIGNIKLNKLPGALSTLAIVSCFRASPGELISISIEDPGRKPLFRTQDEEVKVIPLYRDNPIAIKSTQVAIVLNPAGFHSEGVHHIVLRVGGRVLHREPFGVFVEPREVQ